jgi:hypothetical protein
MKVRDSLFAPVQVDKHRGRPAAILTRTALFILLLFFFLPSINLLALVEDDIFVDEPLFVIQDQTGGGIGSLKGLPVELYQRIPPYYLISSPAASRSSIEEKGFILFEIDRVEPGETLFILTRPSDMQSGNPPATGDVLFHGENWFLVKAQQHAAVLFGREGFRFSHIPLRPLPLVIPKKSAILIPDQGFLSPEAGWKAARSDSTIQSYLQRLQDFQTRYSYTDSVVAAAEWIHDKFIEFGFSDVAYDSFWFDGTWQRNVVATKTGTVKPDKIIIIGGHYDSVTYDWPECEPMTWAPGVDDNGTGTVLAMDMARILAEEEIDKTLKFVLFAAEEQGLYGSYHFAENAYYSGMDIELMINMDMVGNLEDSYLDVDIDTDNQSMSYAELMAQVALDSTDLIPYIGISGYGSDHYPFMQYGFNHVYAQEGDFSPHWHECSDTMDNIDIPYLVQVENMILPTIIIVANSKAVEVEVTCALDSIPRGGNLPFTGSVANQTDNTTTVHVTLWIMGPGGNEFPYIGPLTITLQDGQVISRNLSIAAPSNAPLGEYIVSLEAESLTGELIDRDSFSVTVVGSNNAGFVNRDEFILEGW